MLAANISKSSDTVDFRKNKLQARCPWLLPADPSPQPTQCTVFPVTRSGQHSTAGAVVTLWQCSCLCRYCLEKWCGSFFDLSGSLMYLETPQALPNMISHSLKMISGVPSKPHSCALGCHALLGELQSHQRSGGSYRTTENIENGCLFYFQFFLFIISTFVYFICFYICPRARGDGSPRARCLNIPLLARTIEFPTEHIVSFQGGLVFE